MSSRPRSRPSALVGREAELRTIRAAVGADGLVVVAGPAGIGKSSLARTALGSSTGYREAGALATLAWSPLLVFRRLLRREPPEAPEEVAGAVLRSTQPVLLDDLQWGDDSTLDVVSHLAGRLPVVATVRTGEPRSELVLGALALLGAVQVDLAPLPDEPAEQLVRGLHPDLDGAAVAGLLRAAQGNPLLLGELPTGGGAGLTLVSALVDRVGSLGPAGRAAAERLAVLGRPAAPALLGPGAAELVAAGLATEETGEVAITHELLAEVIVEELGARADAVRLELVPDVGDVEAAHLLHAAGEREVARRLALAAAEGAGRRTRATLLALAVRCAPDLDVDHRIEAARLFTEASQPALARALCAVPGRDDLDPVPRGALLAAEAEAAWMQGRQRECLDLVGRALVDLEGSRTRWEVLALAGSTVEQTFVTLDGRPALDRARRAVALADELGVEQAYARARLASVCVTSGEPGWAELYGEVIALARGSGQHDLARTALVGLLLGHWSTGDAAVAEELARSEMGTGSQPGTDVPWLTVAAYAAVIGLQRGSPRVALVEEFLPILEREPAFRSRPFMEAAVVLALADLGRHTEAADLVAGAVERAGIEPLWRSIAWWATGEAAWWAGRSGAAEDAAAAAGLLGLGDHPAVVQARLVGAHAAAERGAAPDGPCPGVALPAWAPAPVEWSALVAAAAGRVDEAVDGLLAAADGWAGFDDRGEVRCRWAAGDQARRAGRSDAVDLLEAAEARARAVGMAAAEARTHRSLRGLGIARRAPRGTDAGGLTTREAAVLDLVGAGRRTQEIAAALGVEASTVESFVRSAMRKLDAPTRLAAAAQLQRLRAGDAVTDGDGPPSG